MSKQSKHNHNPRNPNICRNCKTNTIGKVRMAYGHTVCKVCSTKAHEEQPAANLSNNTDSIAEKENNDE